MRSLVDRGGLTAYGGNCSSIESNEHGLIAFWLTFRSRVGWSEVRVSHLAVGAKCSVTTNMVCGIGISLAV